MKCEELLGALNDYVDGETQSALCQALEGHLADCNPCRVVIDNIRQTITVCRQCSAEPMPAELHDLICLLMKRRWRSAFPRPRRPR